MRKLKELETFIEKMHRKMHHHMTSGHPSKMKLRDLFDVISLAELQANNAWNDQLMHLEMEMEKEKEKMKMLSKANRADPNDRRIHKKYAACKAKLSELDRKFLHHMTAGHPSRL